MEFKKQPNLAQAKVMLPWFITVFSTVAGIVVTLKIVGYKGLAITVFEIILYISLAVTVGILYYVFKRKEPKEPTIGNLADTLTDMKNILGRIDQKLDKLLDNEHKD